MRRRIPLLALAALASLLVAVTQEPRELGEVEWGRDLDAALAEAKTSGKPLWVLFQEIPGCQTCVSFGDEVLSHPLLVEAIEDEFVPVAIYNNRPGRDRQVLDRYGEPAWNNPVVRFLDSEGKDVLPRRDGVWSPFLVARRTILALERSGRPVPDYLRTAADELTPRHTERATFAMDCYWSGEACLGGIDGIQASRTGSLAGHEVVEVMFDPEQISYAELVRQARARGCADRVFAHSARQEREAREVFDAVELSRNRARAASARNQRYYLRSSRLASLSLTEGQSLRVNAALGNGTDVARWLSPRQRARTVRP